MKRNQIPRFGKLAFETDKFERRRKVPRTKFWDYGPEKGGYRYDDYQRRFYKEPVKGNE